MALESSQDEPFLGDDEFASLDSMGFTSSSQSQQYGMSTVIMPPSASSSGGGPDEGRGGSGSGSGSLMDRIRARTAEQQRLSSSNHSSQIATVPTPTKTSSLPSSSEMLAQQSSQQQQQQHYTQFTENNDRTAFVSQPCVSGNLSHAVANNTQSHIHDETTYSFMAHSGGAEDFSQQVNSLRNDAIPHNIPVYGYSRDDPHCISTNQHHYPQYTPNNFQDKASQAFTQTSEAMKSLWFAGVNGAQIIGTMAKDRMMGGGVSGSGGFLLRDEDSLQQGEFGGGLSANQVPPPPMGASNGNPSYNQAYSMMQYGKTFCGDVIGFVGQLPPWGKVIVGVIFVWMLHTLFG